MNTYMFLCYTCFCVRDNLRDTYSKNYRRVSITCMWNRFNKSGSNIEEEVEKNKNLVEIQFADNWLSII